MHQENVNDRFNGDRNTHTMFQESWSLNKSFFHEQISMEHSMQTTIGPIERTGQFSKDSKHYNHLIPV